MTSALITGVSGGIGNAIALCLLDRGYSVIGTARNPAGRQYPYPILQLDLADDDSIAALAKKVAEPIDVLINNAGVATTTPQNGREEAGFDHLSRRELALIFDTNAIGTFLFTRALLPQLLKGGKRTIINISSGLASIGCNETGGRYAYRSSKAALNMMTKSLAVDLARDGIICIAWSPGWVRTAMGGQNAELSPEQSAVALADFLPKITPEQSGQFISYLGNQVDW